MSEILRGGKKTGATMRKVNRVGTKPRRNLLGGGFQGSYRDAVIGGKSTSTEESTRSAREDFWKEHTWNQRTCSKESYSWGCVVVCERKVVHQSWREVEASLRKLLGTDIRLSPFQCNKALFVCQNEEEAKKIALLGAIAMKEYPEVELAGWWESLNSNKRLAVSYGGWVALEGLPPHLWTKKFFQDIGEACGGLADIDQTTTSFGFLLEAKIKLKTNFTGFIPEVVEVADGDLVFRVRIRQLTPAKRPMLSAEDRGKSESLVGSLKKDQQLQRISGIHHPATAELGKAAHTTGTCVSFRIGAFDCPVTIGCDRKLDHNRSVTVGASSEEHANPIYDLTFPERERGTPSQEQDVTATASQSIEAAVNDFLMISKLKGSSSIMISPGKSKSLELDGKEDGGGSSTEEAQISTSREYFNGTRVEIFTRNSVNACDRSGPNKNNFIPIKLDGVAGLDPQSPNIGDNIVVSGPMAAKHLFTIINGNSALTIHGLRSHQQSEMDFLCKSLTFSNPLEDLRLPTLRNTAPQYMALGDPQQLRAMEFYAAGAPIRPSWSISSSFFGRFGQHDRGGKRLKLLLPHDFGSCQNHLEWPNPTEALSSNLTFTDSVSELEEDMECEADDDIVRSPGGSSEKNSADQWWRRMEDFGMDSVQLLDSDDEDFSAQSSVADGEVDAYYQEEKEISDDFKVSCEDLHNLFINSNLEAVTTLEEATNHEEQSVTEEIGKNKKILKYSRRKKSAGVSANREAQHLSSKFLSKMKVSLFPLKRSLFQEKKNGKVRRGKGEGGFKGESKLHRGTSSVNEDN
ncbi:hypothetical protein ACFXTH_010388 [Malus domestica]